MCGYDNNNHPVQLTIVITVGVAFGFVIGTMALDYIRSSPKKKEEKKPKKCKKLHVTPACNDNVYQQQPPQQQWAQ